MLDILTVGTSKQESMIRQSFFTYRKLILRFVVYHWEMRSILANVYPGVWLPVLKAQQSWDQFQHPPTQWNHKKMSKSTFYSSFSCVFFLYRFNNNFWRRPFSRKSPAVPSPLLQPRQRLTASRHRPEPRKRWSWLRKRRGPRTCQQNLPFLCRRNGSRNRHHKNKGNEGRIEEKR